MTRGAKVKARDGTVGPVVKGFLSGPRLGATGAIYTGRLTCMDVQWTGTGSDGFATFTVTAEELGGATANGILWTDQDVQRGIVPGLPDPPPRELALSEGYPDKRYIFNTDNADEMVEKLLRGDKLFLSPLVWNLRPDAFQAYWDQSTKRIYLYEGKVYLPDSHHRHQAIVKALKIWRDAPSEYPKFTGDRQFKIELYFLTREDEGNYFFDKNQLPTRTEKSKAYDLTTRDDLSLLAKRTIALSVALESNVNRVTDRLTAKNPQVVTLSTLREMMRSLAPENSLDSVELEGLATTAASFYDLLAQVRPELGPLELSSRKRVRKLLLVDSATMMHGYAAIMKEFEASVAHQGAKQAEIAWREKLNRLTLRYRFKNWSGDLFEKANPLWQAVGVTKPGRKKGDITVLNTGAARIAGGRVLRQLLSTARPTKKIEFLARQ